MEPPLSKTSREQLLASLRGGLILSCQPLRGGVFDQADIVCAYAAMGSTLGAVALRIESLRDLQAVRPVSSLPLIGLIKRQDDASPVYITPSPEDVQAIAACGAEIIAFDATDRPRSHSVEALIRSIHAAGCVAMADISTLAEGQHAEQCGADLLATTLSGYTPYSPQQLEPDIALIQALHAAQSAPVIAEGRLHSPAQARQALQAGAHAVTVGTAISRPEVLAQNFIDALREV